MKRKREGDDKRPTKKRKLDIGSEKLQEMICPITKQLFCDPVSAEDGRVYENQAITTWFINSKRSGGNWR